MSNYEYGQVVKDFAQRTLRNLEYIENHAESGEVFEATQLINSMLGLLIFPQQEFYDSIPETSLADLEKQGWPRISTSGDLTMLPKDAKTLKGLMRYLRNGIAHFNLEFLADESSQIYGIRIWNLAGGELSGTKNWEAVISLEDLRILLRKFEALIQGMPPKRLGHARPYSPKKSGEEEVEEETE
jgi:hypothetical protein